MNGGEAAPFLPTCPPPWPPRQSPPNIGFIDANRFVESSDRDPIHWSAEAHVSFGAAIADELVKAG